MTLLVSKLSINKPVKMLLSVPSQPSKEIPWKTIETNGLNKSDSSEITVTNLYKSNHLILILPISKKEKLKWKKKTPNKEPKGLVEVAPILLRIWNKSLP
jgi:hypothetical protein